MGVEMGKLGGQKEGQISTPNELDLPFRGPNYGANFVNIR